MFWGLGFDGSFFRQLYGLASRIMLNGYVRHARPPFFDGFVLIHTA
jgi:hypothetical protein